MVRTGQNGSGRVEALQNLSFYVHTLKATCVCVHGLICVCLSPLVAQIVEF